MGLAMMMMRQVERETGPGWEGVFVAFGPTCRDLACRYTDWPMSRRYYALIDSCPLRMSGDSDQV